MEFQQLRALVAVADSGSVTEAGRRLFLTQPAVTRQIRALEDELGGALFDRKTKPLTPTPLGRTALDQARRILQMSEDLRAQVSSEAGTLRGELRLGVGMSLARRVGPALVIEIRRMYPGVQLFMTSNWSRALSREVEDGTLDAAVVLAPRHAHIPAGLVSKHLAPEPVGLVCSARETYRGTVPVEVLRGARWILNQEGCGYRALLKRTLEGAGIPFVVAVEVADIQIQMELIASGVGVGIIPRGALPPRPEVAGLRPFRIQGVDFSVEARLLHRNSGPILPVVAPVIEATVGKLLRRAPSLLSQPRTSLAAGPRRA
jgi:DNA-binding transcriptional LysR family regulator